jgi:hypothetical protein
LIQGVGAKNNRVELDAERKEFLRGSMVQARTKGGPQARGESMRHIDVWASGVGEKSGVAVAKRGVANPKVGPEVCGKTVANIDEGDVLKGVQPKNDIFPDGGV